MMLFIAVIFIAITSVGLYYRGRLAFRPFADSDPSHRRSSKPASTRPLPGPSGLPFVGNLFQIPRERPWIKMAEWAKEYGPIYRLRLGFTQLVVISSPAIAIELLDKRSAIYSSRPRHIMTSEHVSRGLRLSFMPYNDLWKRERKLLHQLTQPRASAGYEPIQLQESAQLALDLLDRPEQHWAHAQRYAGSTVLQITFNRRARTNTDGSITRMRVCNDQMVRTAVPGAYLVDSLPLLNYLPTFLAPWKVHAASIFDQTYALFGELYRAAAGDNGGSECFVKKIEELRDEYGLEDQQAFFLAGAMFGAGSDTTADTIETFVYTMTVHPDIYRRAQAELDLVVGRERMPDFEDQPKLPYCRAVVQELMRWRTVIPGGLAHMVTADDVYEGYAIPKGSSIVPNHWALHLDTETYSDPTRFDPERFLDKSRSLVGSKWSERGHHAFGFGRRICPGIHIAERSIFITAVRMLWTLEFCQNPDRPVTPDHPFSTGFSSHPLAFETVLKPRGEWVRKVVEETVRAFGPGPVGI